MPYDDEHRPGRGASSTPIGADEDRETEIVARVAGDDDPGTDSAHEAHAAREVPESIPLPVLLGRAYAWASARLTRAWTVLRPALRRALAATRAGLARAWRAAPAGLAVILPLAFVSGLLVGPAIAAPRSAPSDRATVAPGVAADGASADGAHKQRRHKKKTQQAPSTDAASTATAAVDETSDDDLGLDAATPAKPTEPAKTAGTTEKAHRFDPADPGLVYRYPTLTGQTVSPPARLTAKIAQNLPLPAKSGTGRRIVYSASEQHLWIVDAAGTVLRDYPVTGRVDRPGPGTYSVYSKSEQSYNPIAKVTFTHMVRFAYGVTGASIGFHSIPKWTNGKALQTDASLGLALGRGGCVRQTMANATYLYDWSKVGDKVVVTA